MTLRQSVKHHFGVSGWLCCTRIRSLRPPWLMSTIKCLPMPWWKRCCSPETSGRSPFVSSTAEQLDSVLGSDKRDCEPRRQSKIDPHSSYLITGGLGALGLEFAKWLVCHGAEEPHSGGSERRFIGRATGCSCFPRGGAVNVIVAKVDVTQRKEVEKLLVDVRERMPRLKGIMHAAGVLEDRLLVNQSVEAFVDGLSPKLLGAAYLHNLSLDLPLDFFVLYSSAASLVGTAGQCNYIAGNTYLDALSSFRRAAGRPALAINWAPFADAGIASADNSRASRLAARGMASLSLASSHDVLERLLVNGMEDPFSQVGIVSLQLPRWMAFYPGLKGLALFRGLDAEEFDLGAVVAKGNATRPLSTSDDFISPAELESMICDKASAILRVPQSGVRKKVDLISLGMDSLLGLELRSALEPSELKVRLPAGIIWAHSRVDRLASHLHELLAAKRLAPTTIDARDLHP